MARISKDRMYMNMARELSQRSSCERLKVGALIVKDEQIISEGYNGTPWGWHTNDCEDGDGNTKDIVPHAEKNAITKLAKTGGPGAEGATLYCTHSCCFQCAIMIYQTGIDRFVYAKPYRKDRGLEFLRKGGVEVEELGSRDSI